MNRSILNRMHFAFPIPFLSVALFLSSLSVPDLVFRGEERLRSASLYSRVREGLHSARFSRSRGRHEGRRSHGLPGSLIKASVHLMIHLDVVGGTCSPFFSVPGWLCIGLLFEISIVHLLIE